MRKLSSLIKTIAVLVGAVVCVFSLLFLCHSPVFERGTAYELYYGANSSSLMKATKNPVLDKVFSAGVAGESVRYEGDRREEIEARYQAKLLFTEEAAGVTNYYYFSPVLGRGVTLYGHEVNLHVAISSSGTAAGTPLIFGGY